MNLKILGGIHKGRPLKTPSGPLSKPTTSLMRKAAFDICQASLQGSTFLDLFACSGAMGIEALSRGASSATFVEKDRLSIRILLENLKALDLTKQSQVLSGDVFSLLYKLKQPYDLIYIDPPYPLVKNAKKPIHALLHYIDEHLLLAPSGTLFLEEGVPSSFCFQEESFQHLAHKSTRKFGDSILHELHRIA